MNMTEHITIRDANGASLVLEALDGGKVSVWIAPPGQNDGRSVVLTLKDRCDVARFMHFARSDQPELPAAASGQAS